MADREPRTQLHLWCGVYSLTRYVEALGGKFEIHAVFDDKDIKLSA